MYLDGLDLLSEQECRQLLGQSRVGRVVVSFGAGAAVFPVNYIVAGDDIVFFTAEGTKLRAAATNATVSFEVDHIDPFAETGWSVLVAGPAREVTDPAVITGVRRAGLHPWAPGDRFHLVAISIEFLSGRRVGAVIDLRAGTAGQSGQTVGPHSMVGALAQPPVRVGAAWSLLSVADTMREANVAAVLVGHDHAIVTERDLTRALEAGMGPGEQVGAIGRPDLITIDDDTTVVQAGIDMLRHEIRHLLVRNWRGEITGVVGLRDVLRVLIDAMDPAVWFMVKQTLSVVAPRREGSGRT